jgi:hypothetical protein
VLDLGVAEAELAITVARVAAVATELRVCFVPTDEGGRVGGARRSPAVIDIADGLAEIAAGADLCADRAAAITRRRQRIEHLLRVRSGVRRVAADMGRSVPAVSLDPSSGGLVVLGRLLARAATLIDMLELRDEFPCFAVLDEDFTGPVNASDDVTFTAGALLVAQQRNAEGSVRVLDTLGRATWVPAQHPLRVLPLDR